MELPRSASPRKLPKLTMQQIHDNQETLKRINRKIDFQKNPRYQNITQHKYTDTLNPGTMTLAKENKGAFRCQPPEIVFSNFEKDIIYEFEIVLLNTSKLLRRIKVTPIASEEFVVSSIKYPNENSGDIASGMRVKIVIRFLPKEIKTYQSELVILSEDSILKVPIYTIRQQPELQFEPTTDCGSCWTGNKVQILKKIRNIGGDAEFNLSSPNCQIVQSKLITNNFTIEPSSFKLKHNQSILLGIRYLSSTEGSSKSTINILSQYFQGQQPSFCITGNSFKANIELTQMNKCKPSANNKLQKLYLENIVPNQQSVSSIVIKNLANLNLDYYWEIDNKNFTITEGKGCFEPSEEKHFIVKYNSDSYIPDFMKAKIFIGEKSKGNLPEYEIEVTALPQRYSVSLAPNYYKFPSKLVYGTWYQKEVVLKNHSPSLVPYTVSRLHITENTQSEIQQGSSVLQPNQQKTLKFGLMIPIHDELEHHCIYEIDVENSQTMHFEMKGRSVLPSIIVSEKIDFGLVKKDSQSSTVLELENPHDIQLHVKIQNNFKYYLPEHSYLYDYEVEDYEQIDKRLWIEKEEFVIHPREKVSLICLYSSRETESLNEKINIVVEGGINTSVQFMVQVQDVHVLLSSSYFNLKELFVNNVYTLNEFIKKQPRFCLLNLGNIETEFKWENTECQSCRFQFSPSSGTIGPKSKKQISVKIIPLRNIELSHKVVCKTSKQDLTVCFEASIKGLEIKYHIVDEALAKRVIIKESAELTKTDRSRKNPMLSLTASVSQLRDREKVIYPQLSHIDFFNCEINIPKQIEILLVNNSDLETEFSVKALKFNGVVKEKEEEKKRSSVLGKTAPFSSEMGATFIAKRQLEKSQKQYLKDSEHGVTIICEPERGQLKRGSEVKIKLTLFNNICGRFADNLEVQIKNYETKLFPLNIDIKGTPIGISKNQLGINFNSFFPVYKFGCFPTNSGTIRKEFKVVNKGPRPVELIWNIYATDQPLVKDPFKISIGSPSLGSNSPISINWQAFEPNTQQNSLFSIEPKSKIIQAQQQTSFTISYTTLSETQTSKCIFVGQPYLLNDGEQKTKMQLMPIIPIAETVKPQLRIDKYTSNLSDDNLVVLQKYAGEESKKDVQSIILQNPTDSNLICSFQISNPCFTIIDTYTNSGSNNLLSKTQNQFTKSLNKSLLGNTKTVQSCFNIAPSSYVELKLKFDSNIKSNEDWPLSDKFRKEGKLIISYSNDDVQEIPLLGELYRPLLKLNTNGKEGADADEIIDFGVVHIKNDKKKTLYLTNLSPVRGKWALKYVKLPTKRKFQQALWTKQDQQDSLITDEKQCFNFSINQGTVESLTIPIKTMPNTLALPSPDDNYAKTHVPQKIMIAFKPKKDILYKSKFKILVENGESIEFVLRGMGTYDEEYQK